MLRNLRKCGSLFVVLVVLGWGTVDEAWKGRVRSHGRYIYLTLISGWKESTHFWMEEDVKSCYTEETGFYDHDGYRSRF